MAALDPAVADVSGTAQVYEGVPVSITTGAARGVIAPFIANMYADASGTVGTLQQVTVTMTGIDQIFDVTLSDADAVKILNAFRVDDVNYGYGESNQAEVAVSMKNSANFQAALAGALKDTAIYNWVKAEARKDTVDILSYDTLVNLLEASDLLTFDVAIDASGGAADMYSRMDAEGAALQRKAIFSQIAKPNVEAYITPSEDGLSANLEDVSGLEFLPLLKGDKLTFVFDVAVGDYDLAVGAAPSSGAKILSVVNDASVSSGAAVSSSMSSAAAGGATTTAVNANNYAGPNARLTFTTPTQRRIALTLKMSDGGVAFPVAGGASLVTRPMLA